MNRHSNKPIDLSRTIRLSGLSSGAKLELVLQSRSPTALSVALQLPESEAQPITSQRLTHKFPSTTSLWLVLRAFESNVSAESGSNRNFTARGAPKEDHRGAGRLYHELPVIQVLGRELASFLDLQKTLSQLGFNSGSVLLRLSFRITETPLEEAMEEIGRYFKSLEGEEAPGAHAGNLVVSERIPDPSPPVESESPTEEFSAPEDATVQDADTDQRAISPPVVDDLNLTDPEHRPISVYGPPSSSTPRASLQPFNEKDYEPTINQAKLHQSRLAATARNKRLKTHSEEAAEKEVQRQKAANITEVEIKVRFPDQVQVVSKFSNLDTTTTLYGFVRSCLENENEPFSLNFAGSRGPQSIPQEETVKLISGLGMTGRILVNFIWAEGASLEARTGQVLKDRFQEKAREIEIKNVEVEDDDDRSEQNKTRSLGQVSAAKADGKGKRIPKWLKLPGKK